MNDTVIMARPTGHPLAGQQMTGAQMLVQVLADEGVTAIFGYSGGAILPTYDAVFLFNEQAQAQGTRQVPLIVPANEQGAGFMAAGYARASGRVGRVPGDLRVPAPPTRSRRCATAWPIPFPWW